MAEMIRIPRLRAAFRAHRRGQMLIEALVGLNVLLIGFLAIFGLLSGSLSANRVIMDNYSASYLAAEGVEIVKSLVDENALQLAPWGAGLADGNYEVVYLTTKANPPVPSTARPLNFDAATHAYSYASGPDSVPTSFVRRVELRGSVDDLRVNAVVEWTTRGKTYAANVEDHFLNWRR